MLTVVWPKSSTGMKMIRIAQPILALLAGAIVLWASGCGLKGDLYIPEEESAPTTPVDASDDDLEADSENQPD